MSEQHLKLLRRQLSELEKVGSNPATQMEYSFGVEAWKSATISILERIYGKESKKIELIDKIELRRSIAMKGPDRYRHS